MSYYTRDNPTRLLYVIRKSICGLSLGGLYMDDDQKEN